MKYDCNVICNWSDSYLDAWETLYGSFNLHPALTIMEVGEEWQRCFSSDGKLQRELEQVQPLKEWSASYLDTLEALYGEFHLHPQLSIQALCEEWRQCFIPAHDILAFAR